MREAKLETNHDFADGKIQLIICLPIMEGMKPYLYPYQTVNIYKDGLKLREISCPQTDCIRP